MPAVGAVQNHDDTGYGTSITQRGNPTQVAQWVSGTTYLTTALSYDTTGQVTAIQDSDLNNTYYYYTDNFWIDNGKNPPNQTNPGTKSTNAYRTSVADNIGTTHAGYYWGSGKTAWTEDFNQVFTYFHFLDGNNSDLFDRPGETDYPIGWHVNAYTSLTQTDAYDAVGDITSSA